jgi:hypothetical protein
MIPGACSSAWGRLRSIPAFATMLVRAPITHLGVVRGQVLILVDLSQEIEGFIRVLRLRR